jgi:multidrug resistance efflux pump
MDGVVADIFAGEGQRVAQDGVVLTLDSADLEYALQMTAARIAGMNAELRALARSRQARLEASERLRAARDELVAEQRLLEHRAEVSRVRSPIAGSIVTPRLRENRGLSVKRGDVLFEVVDGRTMEVEIKVREEDADLLQEGLPVVVKVPSMPTRTFHGKLEAIGAKFQSDGNGASYVVARSLVPNGDELLRPEMTGVAEVRAGRRNLLYHAGRRLIRWIRLWLLL